MGFYHLALISNFLFLVSEFIKADYFFPVSVQNTGFLRLPAS